MVGAQGWASKGKAVGLERRGDGFRKGVAALGLEVNKRTGCGSPWILYLVVTSGPPMEPRAPSPIGEVI